MIRGQCGACAITRDFGDNDGAELREFVSLHWQCEGLRIGVLARSLPAGAALATEQHLREILATPRGRRLVSLAAQVTSAERDLATFIARALIFGLAETDAA